MNYALARQNMVDGQIRPNKVIDPTLIEALATVPRERFVPDRLRSIAYVDEDIRIGPDRWLMEPMVLARLLQVAEVERSDVVLDIGCASGYAAALLSRMANTVVALESEPELAAIASELLSELSADNVVVLEGSLEAGCPKQAPFNVILIEGAVETVPPAITAQLAEGGRLVTVMRGNGPGRATLMTRTGGVVSGRPAFDASVAWLPGFRMEPGFVF
jgi:protein-L-isoaspartate(D-aspartate) O-methyltransferase